MQNSEIKKEDYTFTDVVKMLSESSSFIVISDKGAISNFEDKDEFLLALSYLAILCRENGISSEAIFSFIADGIKSFEMQEEADFSAEKDDSSNNEDFDDSEETIDDDYILDLAECLLNDLSDIEGGIPVISRINGKIHISIK